MLYKLNTVPTYVPQPMQTKHAIYHRAVSQEDSKTSFRQQTKDEVVIPELKYISIAVYG